MLSKIAPTQLFHATTHAHTRMLVEGLGSKDNSLCGGVASCWHSSSVCPICLSDDPVTTAVPIVVDPRSLPPSAIVEQLS